MKSFSALPLFRRCGVLFSLFLCTLALGSLCVSCGGGGGGSATGSATDEEERDPMEGEGTLETPPEPEELDKAPETIVENSYNHTELRLSNAEVELSLELKASSPQPMAGTLAGFVSLQGGEPSGSWTVDGTWEQNAYNEQDVVRDVTLGCAATNTGSNLAFTFYNLDLSIQSRVERDGKLLLTGTVTAGQFRAYRNNNVYPAPYYPLVGASFTLTMTR